MSPQQLQIHVHRGEREDDVQTTSSSLKSLQTPLPPSRETLFYLEEVVRFRRDYRVKDRPAVTLRGGLIGDKAVQDVGNPFVQRVG